MQRVSEPQVRRVSKYCLFIPKVMAAIDGFQPFNSINFFTFSTDVQKSLAYLTVFSLVFSKEASVFAIVTLPEKEADFASLFSLLVC